MLEPGDTIIAIGTPAEIVKLEELVGAPEEDTRIGKRRQVLAELLQRVVAEWAAEQGWAEVPACLLERPADEAHGDYATPVCMQTGARAPSSRRGSWPRNSRAPARRSRSSPRSGEDIEVAGPGFINFTLSAGAYTEVMTEMLAQGGDIGRGAAATPPRVNLEFVSVNPNGPLHVGHGRYAAYGDALKRLLAFSGANVATEFYINDYGRQMDRFGRSVAARYAQSFGVDLPVPADGYQGDYVAGIAAAIRTEVGDRYVGALTAAAGLARGRRRPRAGRRPAALARRRTGRGR